MMDKILNYKTLFKIGAALVIIGFVVPLLMVMEIIPGILWLQLLIGAFQMIGLLAGILGSVLYVKEKRK